MTTKKGRRRGFEFPDDLAARGAPRSSQPSRLQERLANDRFLRQAAQTALLQLRPAPGERILAFDCGSAAPPMLARAVGPRGSVAVVAPAPSLLAAAGERLGRAELDAPVTAQLAYPGALPFAAGDFDAAFDDRALLQLDEPRAAIRELRRVLRPGGRLVLVEPVLGAIRVDHPDQAGMRLVLDAYFSSGFRQPDAGLSLNRWLCEAEFVDRQLVPLQTTLTSLAAFRRYGFELQPTVERLVAAGRLSRERAEALFAEMRRASREGRFYATGGVVVAFGRVPVA